MSRWLKNVGQFLDQLDDQVEQQVIVDDEEDEDDDDVLRRPSGSLFQRLGSTRGPQPYDDDDDDEAQQYYYDEEEEVQYNEEDAAGRTDGPPMELMKDENGKEEIVNFDAWDQPNDNNGSNHNSMHAGILVHDNDAAVETQGEETEEEQPSAAEASPALDDPKMSSTIATEVQPQAQSTTTVNASLLPEVDDATYEGRTPVKAAGASGAAAGAISMPAETPFATPGQYSVPPTTVAPSKQVVLPAAAAAAAAAAAQSAETKSAVSSNEQARAEEQLLLLRKQLQSCKARLDKALKEKEAAVADANKESRTLRRHMVTLNEQLESADKEIEAQRKELEDVAVRLEEDRHRRKELMELEKAKHAQELKQQREKHEQMLVDKVNQTDKRIDELQKELAKARHQLRLEGGEKMKELYDAQVREKEMEEIIDTLHDEKDTLVAQISTLQTQQETLASRLESLTNTADNALTREREAEERLDEALTLHARQVSQRQAREAELEKTVTELGAALVAERQKNKELVDSVSNGASKPSDNSRDNDEENENLRAQLEQEREQNEILRKELRSISNERAGEVALARNRQQRHDKEIADMSQQVANLRSELQDRKRESSVRDLNEKATNEDMKHVKTLSEEVVRQRTRLSECNSEISALRSRLHAALNRATVAEAAAESAYSNNDDAERGLSRRGAARNGRKKADAPSMRMALQIDSFEGSNSGGGQSIGKSLDVVDGFLTKSGKILRYNPIARLFFGTSLLLLQEIISASPTVSENFAKSTSCISFDISVLYLLLLHLWTFALLVFHAHGFETVHGDFGQGSLMHQQMHMQPNPRVQPGPPAVRKGN